MSHSPPTDDALLINRQAELPDLLREVLTGMAAELTDAIYEGRDVDPTPICTALGVGKPEQSLTATMLRTMAYAADDLTVPSGKRTPFAVRIERAIGGGDGK